MKCGFFGLFFILAMVARGQDCKLLNQTFAVADTIKKESGELYVFRFSAKQLDDLQKLTELEKPLQEIKKLQKTLDEDYASYKNGILWQLDEKLAERQLAGLRKQCPETGFKVFEREINYYKEKYKAKD
jgi:flagellar motility protein MotE (MotC chaperone)